LTPGFYGEFSNVGCRGQATPGAALVEAEDLDLASQVPREDRRWDDTMPFWDPKMGIIQTHMEVSVNGATPISGWFISWNI